MDYVAFIDFPSILPRFLTCLSYDNGNTPRIRQRINDEDQYQHSALFGAQP